jgi:ABC-type uncharacterized transport system substrate-binding protein
MPPTNEQAHVECFKYRRFILYGKRLELLKEAVPKTSRVVFFWYRSSEAVPSLLNDIQTPAKALGLQLQSIEVLNRNDFDDPFRAAVKWGGARSHGLHPPGIYR